MDKIAKLGEALRRIAAPDGVFITIAEVVSIQGDTCTVRVSDTLEVDGVRLRASRKALGERLLITPAVGSDVLVGSLSGDWKEIAVLSVDSADKIEYSKGSLSMVLDARTGEMVFNGGSLGGMVVLGKMVEWMQKVSSDLIELQTLLSTSSVTGNGAALGIVFNPSTTIPKTSDFENRKIKQ